MHPGDSASSHMFSNTLSRLARRVPPYARRVIPGMNRGANMNQLAESQEQLGEYRLELQSSNPSWLTESSPNSASLFTEQFTWNPNPTRRVSRTTRRVHAMHKLYWPPEVRSVSPNHRSGLPKHECHVKFETWCLYNHNKASKGDLVPKMAT